MWYYCKSKTDWAGVHHVIGGRFLGILGAFLLWPMGVKGCSGIVGAVIEALPPVWRTVILIILGVYSLSTLAFKIFHPKDKLQLQCCI